MKTLGAPWVSAAAALALAALLHPAAGAEGWSGADASRAALALLLLFSLFAAGGPWRWLALAVAAVAGASGYDAVRGHRGLLRLEPGGASQNFEEAGPRGRPLGLRPLGFEVWLQRYEAGHAVLGIGSTGGDAKLVVTPTRAAAWGGFRLGSPRRVRTGEAAALRVSINGPSGTHALDLVPGAAASAGDLQIAVEEYFPDFALDERQRPFTRSNEPRNPAAVLQVKKGERAWRVFVIAAMPGIHRPEGLDRSFSLVSVTPAETIELSVAREPAAPLAAAGLVFAAAAVVSTVSKA
ncbi:MAG TPA: hypothetical protein VGQ78_04320 [Vicinamibacteria bacterium]|nr:hypothetical protein [Vicinamibacteria bacterium]